MSEPNDRNQLPHLQQALAVIQTLKSKLRRLEDERAKGGPIAIVGMACRFPGGAHTPDQLWEFLRAGGNAVSEAPPDRWDHDRYYDPNPDTPGKIVTRYGAFLDRIAEFDARFFGISDREAAFTDPQHRMLTELCWEALENAAIVPHSVRGSKTGVFVGISSYEFSHRLLQSIETESIGPYLAVGSALSAASGRINYLFDLSGPALSFDTACSSSLTAVHAARLSLSVNECDMALVGATNVVLLPESMMCFSQAHMLSPDGSCKTFDQSANGYVRGEGCGVIVLKRLADAELDGDYVHGVLLGSAVNSDAGSSGLTVPSGKAQEDVIRAALASADLEPGAIDYVETHGTGTALGDPIEANALIRTLAKGRPNDRPLLIGSVKTNFGHLEAASGMLGLMKTVLAMQHEELPPHLHFNTPNDKIPWDSSPIRVTAQTTAWPKSADRPRKAGVSSFGITGANTHIVLGEAPDREATVADNRPSVLPLSARAPSALAAMCAQLADHLEHRPETCLADAAHTLQVGRQQFPVRYAVTGMDVREVTQALRDGASRTGTGDTASKDAPPIAFAFTSSDAQPAADVGSPYQSEPAFQEKLAECADLVQNDFQLDIRESIAGPRADGNSTAERFASVAAEIATVHLWKTWGVRPKTVTAYGAGVFAALYAAELVEFRDVFHLLGVSEGIDNELTRQPLSAIRLNRSLIPLSILENSVEESGATPSHNGELGAFLQQFASSSLDSAVQSDGDNAIVLHFGVDAMRLGGRPANVVRAYPNAGSRDEKYALQQLAKLWTSGVAVNWANVQRGRACRRIALPTYPFERRSFTLPEPSQDTIAKEAPSNVPQAPAPTNVWQTETWGRAQGTRSRKSVNRFDADATTIVFSDGPFGDAIAERLAAMGRRVETVVLKSAQGEESGSGCFAVDRESSRDFDRLIREMLDSSPTIDRVVYAWTLVPAQSADSANGQGAVYAYSAPVSLIRALRTHANRDDAIEVVTLTSNAARITGTEAAPNWLDACPFGFSRVAYRSGPSIRHRTIDLDSDTVSGSANGTPIDAVCTEILRSAARAHMALRSGTWWNRFRCAVDIAPVSESEASAESLLFMDRSGHALELAPGILEHADSNVTVAIESGIVSDSPARLLNSESNTSVRALDTASIASQVDKPALAEACRPGGDVYQQAMDASIRFIARYLRSGGSPLEKGDTLPISRLRFTLGVYPRFERFFNYLLHVLEREGYVELEGDSLSVVREFQRESAASETNGSILANTIQLLDTCSRAYPQAFRQAIDPITVLYPDGRSDLLTRAISESADCFELESRKTAAIAVTAELAKTTPRPLRILEVGGGVGELTWPLAESLQAYSPEYCFTDIGKGFVAEARKEAAKRGLSFMRFGTLDISKDPYEQQFERHSFDVVVALNVVHATPRIDETLQYLKALVRPGGYLALIEAVRSDPWVNMVWGLAEGWWLFEDSDLRQYSPLISLDQWERALERAGFESVQSVPDDAGDAALTDSALFIAKQGDNLRNSANGTASRNGAAARAVETLRASWPELAIAEWPGRDMGGFLARAAAQDGSGAIYVLPEIPIARVQGGLSPLRDDACRDWLRELADALRALGDAAATNDLEFFVLLSYSVTHNDPELELLYAASRALAESFIAEGNFESRPHWRMVHIDRPAQVDDTFFIEAAGRALVRALRSDAPEIVYIDETLLRTGAPATDGKLEGDAQQPTADHPSLPEADRPTNEFERRVCAIWEDVLGTSPIGIHESFLDVGGDSITGTQISSRITTEFTIEIDPKDFLENPPTISTLSMLVIEKLEAEMAERGVELVE